MDELPANSALSTSASRTSSKRREHAERVELCRKLLAARVSENDIERVLTAKYGTNGRAAQRYLTRAKQSALDAASRPQHEHLADAYAFYCSLIANPNAKDADKLKAQERIDKLLALDASRHGAESAARLVTRLPSWLIGSIERAGPVPTAEPTNVVDGAEEYERLMVEAEARSEDSPRTERSDGGK
jgi:hypothetical protein